MPQSLAWTPLNQPHQRDGPNTAPTTPEQHVTDDLSFLPCFFIQLFCPDHKAIWIFSLDVSVAFSVCIVLALLKVNKPQMQRISQLWIPQAYEGNLVYKMQMTEPNHQSTRWSDDCFKWAWGSRKVQLRNLADSRAFRCPCRNSKVRWQVNFVIKPRAGRTRSRTIIMMLQSAARKIYPHFLPAKNTVYRIIYTPISLPPFWKPSSIFSSNGLNVILKIKTQKTSKQFKFNKKMQKKEREAD